MVKEANWSCWICCTKISAQFCYWIHLKLSPGASTNDHQWLQAPAFLSTNGSCPYRMLVCPYSMLVWSYVIRFKPGPTFLARSCFHTHECCKWTCFFIELSNGIPRTLLKALPKATSNWGSPLRIFCFRIFASELLPQSSSDRNW